MPFFNFLIISAYIVFVRFMQANITNVSSKFSGIRLHLLNSTNLNVQLY